MKKSTTLLTLIAFVFNCLPGIEPQLCKAHSHSLTHVLEEEERLNPTKPHKRFSEADAEGTMRPSPPFQPEPQLSPAQLSQTPQDFNQNVIRNLQKTLSESKKGVKATNPTQEKIQALREKIQKENAAIDALRGEDYYNPGAANKGHFPFRKDQPPAPSFPSLTKGELKIELESIQQQQAKLFPPYPELFQPYSANINSEVGTLARGTPVPRPQPGAPKSQSTPPLQQTVKNTKQRLTFPGKSGTYEENMQAVRRELQEGFRQIREDSSAHDNGTLSHIHADSGLKFEVHEINLSQNPLAQEIKPLLKSVPANDSSLTKTPQGLNGEISSAPKNATSGPAVKKPASISTTEQLRAQVERKARRLLKVYEGLGLDIGSKNPGSAPQPAPVRPTPEPVLPNGNVGQGVGKLESAKLPANNYKLRYSLASEQQMKETGSIIAGKGAKKTFTDAPRIVSQYGGKLEDWVKKKSSTYNPTDVKSFRTHWVENIQTGERIELKIKLKD